MKAREALNRNSYIEAALEVIGDIGVDKLSMRNVASRLDVSPMAMYKHFATKDELLAAAFEAFIARANVIPDNAMPWEQWVEHVARRMYQALCRELSWVPLLGSLRFGAQADAVTGAFLGKLGSAGFSAEQSVSAFVAIIQVVVGAVCLRSSLDAGRAGNAGPVDALSSARRSLPDSFAGGHGLTEAELIDTLLQDQIEIGLPLILSALKAQLGEAGRHSNTSQRRTKKQVEKKRLT